MLQRISLMLFTGELWEWNLFLWTDLAVSFLFSKIIKSKCWVLLLFSGRGNATNIIECTLSHISLLMTWKLFSICLMQRTVQHLFQEHVVCLQRQEKPRDRCFLCTLEREGNKERECLQNIYFFNDLGNYFRKVQHIKGLSKIFSIYAIRCVLKLVSSEPLNWFHVPNGIFGHDFSKCSSSPHRASLAWNRWDFKSSFLTWGLLIKAWRVGVGSIPLLRELLQFLACEPKLPNV